MSDGSSYNEVVWLWFLSKAGPSGRWGGMDYTAAEEIRAHVAECGMDHESSEDPTTGTMEDYRSTFHPSFTKVAVMAHYWRCRCGEYSHENMGTLYLFEELGISEIISEVISLGLGASTKESGNLDG